MTSSPSEPRSLFDARDAAVKLADAVNQLALVVEEIGDYAVQHGYTDSSNARRRRWRETLRAQREVIAELIPE